MNFKIQRYTRGHKYYTEASITHDGKTYQSIFGQCIDESGKFLHYTMERKDTLIDEGEYEYDLYFSPNNKTTVPRLTKDPKGIDISLRVLEHHIANFPYELKGCCAHGVGIMLKSLMITQSGPAFHDLMNLIGSAKGGKITYETYTSL